jgi:hypothetical protein
LRFSAATAVELTEAYVATGRRAMEYEEPIRDMIIASNVYDTAKPGDAGNPGRFGFADISGLPQSEIDFPEVDFPEIEFPENMMKARALVSELVA